MQQNHLGNEALQFWLESGRLVRLVELHLLPTTTDWMSVPARTMADQISELVAKFWYKGAPMLLKPERSNILPPFTCLASFRSEPFESHGVCVEASFLVICWFTDSPGQSIRNLACE